MSPIPSPSTTTQPVSLADAPDPPVARARVLRALGVALVGALAGFWAVDLWVGWLDREQGEAGTEYYLRDPLLGWSPRPHFENAETGTRLDRYGMRNPEIPADAPPDEVRIIGLGASRIYGAGGAHDSVIWRPLLQQALDAETSRYRGKVRLLNAGVMGYSAVQAARRATQLIPLVQPDLVFVVVSPGSQMMLDPSSARNWVRFDDELVPRDVVEGWPLALRRPVLAVHRLLLHSNLYVRYRNRFRLGDDKLRDTIQRWVLSRDEPPPEIAEMLDRTFTELAALGRIAAAHGCQVRIAVLPEHYQDSDEGWINYLAHNGKKGAPRIDTPRWEPTRVLQKRCEAIGLATWDMSPEVDTIGSNRDRFMMKDNFHWSGDGHRVIARGLYERLVETGLLDELIAARARSPRK